MTARATAPKDQVHQVIQGRRRTPPEEEAEHQTEHARDELELDSEAATAVPASAGIVECKSGRSGGREVGKKFGFPTFC